MTNRTELKLEEMEQVNAGIYCKYLRKTVVVAEEGDNTEDTLTLACVD